MNRSTSQLQSDSKNAIQIDQYSKSNDLCHCVRYLSQRKSVFCYRDRYIHRHTNNKGNCNLSLARLPRKLTSIPECKLLAARHSLLDHLDFICQTQAFRMHRSQESLFISISSWRKCLHRKPVMFPKCSRCHLQHRYKLYLSFPTKTPTNSSELIGIGFFIMHFSLAKANKLEY